MDGWEQIVYVTSVDAFDILTPLEDATTDMIELK